MTAAPDHKERAHSKLGASGAHRWIACPGSLRLAAGIPDKETIFAAEGTAAHELCELCLRSDQAAEEYIGRTITVGNHKFEVDEEMAEAVQVYLDTVRAAYAPADGDMLMIEERFDLSRVYPGMFGTGDAGVYKAKDKKLVVIDYKHGKGHAVDADDNPQLKYYGIGMLETPILRGKPVEKVELVIVQPRAPHKDGPVRRWEADVMDLLEFTGDLQVAARLTEDPDAPLAAGPHCKFCAAAGICPKLREQAIADAKLEFAASPEELTDEDLADLLEKADLIKGWIAAVAGEAYRRAEGGAKVPGWKLVQKRAVRKWAGDPDDIAKQLTMLLPLEAEDILETKLRSPAQVEKLLPKSERADLKAFIVAESSGTTLARETDRRSEVAPSGRAADEFDPIGD